MLAFSISGPKQNQNTFLSIKPVELMNHAFTAKSLKQYFAEQNFPESP